MRMKNILAVVLAAGVLAASLPTAADASSNRRKVPRVAYVEPDNDSVIDLTGKKSLTFVWKGQPVPGGGRDGFRFRLYKGFSYDVVFGEDLGRDVMSIEVPADKFEDGILYSWHVEQRDGSNMRWSLHDTWSFTVKKGK